MPKQTPTIKFSQYAPDLTSIGTGVANVVSGCLPQADGYGPFRSLVELTSALPGPCRGYFFARRSDGTVAVFAGTATDLYLLSNTDYTWENVSKGGAPYATLPSTDNWQFRQFNEFVIAVQVNVAPQKFNLTSSTDFVDLGGSPPQASHVAIVNRFVMLTGLLSNPRRAQWCDLDAPETWTAGVGLADFQDFPDGGTAFGLTGGDAYGIVFQDDCIRSLTYAPGSAVTFQITRISTEDSLYAKYSPVNAGSRTFFLSAQGFKVIEPGGTPKPIGKERVDRTFFADVDPASLQLIVGATDPKATRVYWPYKSLAGTMGLFDKVLCFDWSIGEQGQWSLLPISGEYLASLAKPSITLESLDALAPTPLTVLGAANNGSGAIRLTLNAVSNANFAISGQNFIVVQGVVGTTEANGQWAVTIVDSTHIDLIGSTFVNAYVSGGAVGGALDAMTASLDSYSKAAQATLSAFSSNHKAGFFSGPNIEAIIDTPEQDLEGNLVFISGVRPMTDCPDVLVSIGGRLRPQDAVSFSSESAVGAYDGICPALVETRYAKARARHPAGSTWTYSRGVQPEASPAGDR
jgi:hypothetical protein